MGQGSNTMEKEMTDMMNVEEVARMSEWLRAKGLKDTDIVNCLTYIATGVGLPAKESEQENESK